MSVILFKDAELCFSCGQFQECVELLHSAVFDSLPFTRTQWRVTANLLAARMQIALKSGDVAQLVHVHTQYLSLWNTITGLPTNPKSLSTELVVTFALCQLEQCMLYNGCHANTYALATLSLCCQRLCRHIGIQWAGLTDSLPLVGQTCLSNSDEDFQTSPQTSLVKVLLRAAFLAALSQLNCDGCNSLLVAVWRALKGETESIQTDSVFELAMKVKGQLEDNSNGDDLRYYEAWRQYDTSLYGAAVDTLEVLSSHAHTTPVINLLRAHCYISMSKPHLAQCCYLACLENSTTSLPAMASCSLLYQQLPNSKAEMDARILTLKALQSRGDRLNQGRQVLLWWKEEGFHTEPLEYSGKEWAELAYCTALRAMHLNRLDIAASVLEELVGFIAQDLPVSFPPPSLLHLLCAKALFMCDQYDKSLAVCGRLVGNLANITPAVEAGDVHSVVVLAQALFLAALSSVHLNQLARGKCLSNRSYQVCRYAISKFDQQEYSTIIDSIIKLMVSNLSLLSVLSVGKCNQKEALTLVSQATCLSHSTLATYNHCLLLYQLGKIKNSAHSWLKGRGLLPNKGVKAHHFIAEKIEDLQVLGPSCGQEKDYTRLDIAMLRVWIKYSPPSCA